MRLGPSSESSAFPLRVPISGTCSERIQLCAGYSVRRAMAAYRQLPVPALMWWPVLISGIARNFDFIDAFHQYRFGIEQPVSEINGYVRVHDILCAHTGAYFATHSASACAFTTNPLSPITTLNASSISHKPKYHPSAALPACGPLHPPRDHPSAAGLRPAPWLPAPPW